MCFIFIFNDMKVEGLADVQQIPLSASKRFINIRKAILIYCMILR